MVRALPALHFDDHTLTSPLPTLDSAAAAPLAATAPVPTPFEHRDFNEVNSVSDLPNPG